MLNFDALAQNFICSNLSSLCFNQQQVFACLVSEQKFQLQKSFLQAHDARSTAAMFSSMKGTSLDLNAIPRVSSTVKNCCYGLNVEKNLVQESICEEK